MFADAQLILGLPINLPFAGDSESGNFEALLFIGLLIVVAKLVQGVLSRLGLSSIVAYTLAGVVLGPVGFGLIEITDHIQPFLDIGVFIFFFLIGLDEIDIPGFMSTIRGRYFVAATVAVVISILGSLVVTADLFNLGFELGFIKETGAAAKLEFNEALSLAGILSLSSLGLVAKVLADRGLLKELIGLRIFTAVIIVEVLALLIVGLAIGGDEDQTLSILGVLELLGKIAASTIVIWIVSAKALPRVMALLQRFLNVPELSYGLLIGGLFLVVVGAENLGGLHGSLGALLFGAALSGLPHRMREDIMPGMRSTAEGLFVPLFFASAGLYLDFSFIHLPPMTIIALLFIPLATKIIASFVGTYLARLDTPIVLSVGLMGKGVAEIALLLVLLETQVIGQDVFSLLVIIMFGYILLTPPVIAAAVNRAKTPETASQPRTMVPAFARHALAGVMVGSVIDRSHTYPDPEITVNDFLADWIVPDQTDYLIIERGAPVGTVSLARVNSRRRLLFWRRGSFGDTPLRRLMRRGPPQANPDEPIEDALGRMAENSLTIIPVMDRNTGQFLGMVSSNEILELVALMDEIREEARRMAAEPAD